MSIQFSGTTGTGLDTLVETILTDEGLAACTTQEDIEAGARAADGMNTIIVSAIRALGIASDGEFTASDIRDLADYISENNYETFKELHGDDENGEETGFHLVQNDGAATYMFGRNAVNSIADGIYHLVFGYENSNIINEDGNRNAELRDMAWWLNELLEEDLAEAVTGEGPLASTADPKAVTRSGSGLDQLVDMILNDPGLNDRISGAELQEGAQAAADINAIIHGIIVEKGLANDGKITASDVYDINAAIQSDPELYARFVALHGDDEDGSETGFHLVQNDGANTRLYANNGTNTIADSIYHIGFDIVKGRFVNEDGNANASVESVASWINNLLEDDFENGTLVNDAADPLPGGSTGTGLDRLVNIIETDVALEARIAGEDISGGASAANTINQLILDGIKATGAANDGKIDAADMRDINTWIRADEARYEAFVEAHGDDEDGSETGFHLVQNDGAFTRLYGENAVNTIADGIFHVGFEIVRDRFQNEDGNANQSVEDVAAWIDQLLTDEDFEDLRNEDVEAYVEGSTGTGLDKLIDIINEDPGLEYKIASSEIAGGARAANGLNALILEGIAAVGAADDGLITAADVLAINEWIRSDEARLQEFTDLHGNDEGDIETGFHLVQGDGSRTSLLDNRAVDTVMDGLYHIGFEVQSGRFLNEDGTRNASVDSVADWLNDLLAEDLATGNLGNVVDGPTDPNDVDVAALQANVVYSGPDVDVNAAGEGFEIVEHSDALALAEGTLTFNFKANDADSCDRDVLFSKDGSGYQDGGHTTIWISRGHLYARFQTDSDQIYLKAYNAIDSGEDYSLAFTFNGEIAHLYLNGERVDVEESTASWEGNDEEMAVGANIWARSQWREDWVDDQFDGTVTDLQVLNVALNQAEVQAFTGHIPSADDVVEIPTGNTGTGLDQILDIIAKDVGLAQRISQEDIAGGASAANGMNAIIVEALQTIGLANDGTITAADVRSLSDWIAENKNAEFTALHGDDEGDSETGFHLIQNDGGQTRLFGDSAVNTVFDGIYHLVFGYDKYRITNEDGNGNASLEDIAWWLEALLEDDLTEAAEGTGALFNGAVDAYAVEKSGTGFDQITDTILNDVGLTKYISTEDQVEGAKAAAGISAMILQAIDALGLANDGAVTASDVYAINDWIRSDDARYQEFVELHGDDENGEETGFHLVQNDGAQSRLFSTNAVNTIFDGIFHIGFEIQSGRLVNEDGNKNASVESVAYWINQLLTDDLQAGTLDNGVAEFEGTTGTGLDDLVDIILDDPGLENRTSELEIREGAQAANVINELIKEAIIATGIAQNGTIKTSDIYEINAWIKNDPDRYEAFLEAHGDDEADGTETGFHLVQNDGGTTLLYGDRALQTVADGLYHIGFDIQCGRLLNEDGDRNASIKTVAGWLSSLLSTSDFAALAAQSTDNPYIYGTTGTGLDTIVDTITEDDGLIERISTSDIRGGAEAAQGLNEIILSKIIETGVANDGGISTYDAYLINQAIRGDADALARFTELHGDDEGDEETGFHLVQNDGSRTELFDRSAINTVADGIYHIGFEVQSGRFLNEDGAKNASVSQVAEWLDSLLQDDFEAGSLVNDALLPENVDLGALKAKEILSLDGPLDVTKSEGNVEFADQDAFDLSEGTVIVGFTADNPDGWDKDTLFSRDASGYGDGGHLTIYVQNNDLISRFQNTDSSIYLKARDVVYAGEENDVAFSFDGQTASLYLNGQLQDAQAFDATWEQSDEAIEVGASLMYRYEGSDSVRDRFEGEIDSFQLFDEELNFAEIQAARLEAYDLA